MSDYPGARRYTEFPVENRPEHAISDSPYVINMKKSPFECIKCANPCDKYTFYYEDGNNIDCEERYEVNKHNSSNVFDDMKEEVDV